mgnify:CR=1 FL=1
MSKKHIRNNEVINRIGAGFRELRKAAGKGQKEVIGNIEAGLFNPMLDTIDRLCRYYGTTLGEFFRELEM